MSDRTIFYIVTTVMAIVASLLFAWLTGASQSETHIMFLGWLLLLKTKGPDA